VWRIGIIGDTQGRYSVDALLEFVRQRFSKVDEIWFAGDWQEERVLSGLLALERPMRTVNGNAPDDPGFPEHIQAEIEGVRIGMVHRPPPRDARWIQSLDIVIHGHTHRWRDEVVGGVRLINVSTPTAATVSGERSIGILSLSEGKADLLKIPVPHLGARADQGPAGPLPRP